MNAQGLCAVIQQLKRTNTKENAYLGFFHNDNSCDTCYIKANKEGLELYATKLLEASLEMGNRRFNESEKEVFNLPSRWFVKDSDFQFTFIELEQKTKAEIVKPFKESHDETWQDTFAGYLIMGCFIFALSSMIIGSVTIIAWIF